MEWEGRAVLITGGSRGIGLATAGLFLGAGASVMIAGRSAEALAAAQAGLSGPGRLRTVAADVSTVPGCRAAAEAAQDAFGRLDVLFTNAGSYEAARSHLLRAIALFRRAGATTWRARSVNRSNTTP